MKDPKLKTSKAGDLVIDFCAVTCFKAKVCMLLDQHKTFVGCDLDSTVLSAAEPDLVLTVVSQVLRPTSDIRGSGEVKAAAKLLTDEIDAVLAGKNATVWEVSPEPDATQVMPDHTLHFLLALEEY